MGKMKELAENMAPGEWSPSEAQMTEMQLQFAQGYATEIESRIDHLLFRMQHYKDVVTKNDLELIREAIEDLQAALR